MPLMTKSYHTVDGEIIGETSSGVRTDYLSDALGSVTGTVDQTAAVINTYRYRPYGMQLASTGTGGQPNFLWVGSLGYRYQTVRSADQYVRSRHYCSTDSAWITRDSFWPYQNGFGYVCGRPTYFIDWTGRSAYKVGYDNPPYGFDAGSGVYNSRPELAERYRFLWHTMESAAWSVMWLAPHGAYFLLNYLHKWMSEINYDAKPLLNASLTARRNEEIEFSEAKLFCNSLPPGIWPITSTKVTGSAVPLRESLDWWLALGKYSYFGKGLCVVKGNCLAAKRSLSFTFWTIDRYDWERGTQFCIPWTRICVSGDDMAMLHVTGLAKDFDDFGYYYDYDEWIG